MNEEPTVPTLLKKWRQRVSYTQRDLAQATGISVSFIQQVEQGVRNFSYDTATLVAEALGLDVYDAELLYQASGVAIPGDGDLAPIDSLKQRVDDLEASLSELHAELAALRDEFRQLVQARSLVGSRHASTPSPDASSGH